MTLTPRAALLPLLATVLAGAARPQEVAVPPHSPGAAAALQAHVARRAHVAQLLAGRAAGTLEAPDTPADEAAPKLAPVLPFTRLLPNTRLALDTAYSTGVVTGDWNTDGLADVVTEASKGASPGILFLRQQDDDDFFVKNTKGSFGNVALKGDVTGDGLVDVVDLGSSAWTYAAKPDGSFAAVKATPFGEFAWWGALGDLNGDGRADIAAADLFTDCDCVHVALGLATGKFGTPTDPAIGADPAGMDLADMNGDGHLDLVTLVSGAANDKVALLPGLGDGSFGPVINSKMTKTLYAMDVAIADYDLDGALDVAALELSTESPSFEAVISMLGAGDGSFTKHGVYACPILGNLLTHGDLDGNGTEDVVTANYDDYYELTGGGMSVLLGLGDGGFGPSTDLDLGGSPQGAATADLDADGDLDVALSQELQLNPDEESAEFFSIVDLGLALGRGDGSFPSALGSPLGAPAVDAAVADLDGDGDGDLVATRKGSETGTSALAYELAAPSAHGVNFGPAIPVPLVQNGRHVGAADLDGDGLSDLVLESGLDGGSLRVLRNLGPGGPQGTLDFAPEQTLGASGVDELALADVDGDGAPDVLALRGTDQRLDVALNAGFTFAVTPVATGAPGTAIALADLDTDGWLDVVLASSDTSTLEVLLNADGALASQAPLGTGFATVALAAADFDVDGRPDLACLSDGGGKVRLLAGQEGNAFTEANSLVLATSAATLVAADLDRDHTPDLVLARPGHGELLVRRGLGNFLFAAAQTVFAAHGTSTLRTADVDGDLFQDVIAIGYGDGAAQVLLSQSAFFLDAGHALAASFGAPRLEAEGLPFAGETVSLVVTGLPSQAVGFLVLGTSPVKQAFHGGTLVPMPQASTIVFAGQPVSDTWPDVPAGLPVWFQAWFANGGEAAATNALVAVTQ